MSNAIRHPAGDDAGAPEQHDQRQRHDEGRRDHRQDRHGRGIARVALAAALHEQREHRPIASRPRPRPSRAAACSTPRRSACLADAGQAPDLGREQPRSDRAPGAKRPCASYRPPRPGRGHRDEDEQQQQRRDADDDRRHAGVPAEAPRAARSARANATVSATSASPRRAERRAALRPATRPDREPSRAPRTRRRPPRSRGRARATAEHRAAAAAMPRRERRGAPPDERTQQRVAPAAQRPRQRTPARPAPTAATTRRRAIAPGRHEDRRGEGPERASQPVGAHGSRTARRSASSAGAAQRRRIVPRLLRERGDFPVPARQQARALRGSPRTGEVVVDQRDLEARRLRRDRRVAVGRQLVGLGLRRRSPALPASAPSRRSAAAFSMLRAPRMMDMEPIS